MRKFMGVNSNPLIKSYGTRTNPAAETKSIGLTADALLVSFLLATSPDPDDQTVVRAGTDGNKLNRHTVMVNRQPHCTLDNRLDN
jgi:hypothetical protein